MPAHSPASAAKKISAKDVLTCLFGDHLRITADAYEISTAGLSVEAGQIKALLWAKLPTKITVGLKGETIKIPRHSLDHAKGAGEILIGIDPSRLGVPNAGKALLQSKFPGKKIVESKLWKDGQQVRGYFIPCDSDDERNFLVKHLGVIFGGSVFVKATATRGAVALNSGSSNPVVGVSADDLDKSGMAIYKLSKADVSFRPDLYPTEVDIKVAKAVLEKATGVKWVIQEAKKTAYNHFLSLVTAESVASPKTVADQTRAIAGIDFGIIWKAKRIRVAWRDITPEALEKIAAAADELCAMYHGGRELNL